MMIKWSWRYSRSILWILPCRTSNNFPKKSASMTDLDVVQYWRSFFNLSKVIFHWWILHWSLDSKISVVKLWKFHFAVNWSNRLNCRGGNKLLFQKQEFFICSQAILIDRKWTGSTNDTRISAYKNVPFQ